MEKKIEFDVLDKIMSDKFPPVITKKWNGVDVDIARSLSFNESLRFVEYVHNVLFSGENKSYTPETMHCALNIAIIIFYTNIELPDDIDRKYEFVTRTDIVGFVLQFINKAQLEALINSIDKKAEVTTADKTGNGKLMNVLERLAGKVTSILDSIDGVDLDKVINVLSDEKLGEDLAVAMLKQNKGNIDNG